MLQIIPTVHTILRYFFVAEGGRRPGLLNKLVNSFYPCHLFVIHYFVVQDVNFRKPLTQYTAEQVKEMGWKYYNSGMHEASFALPQFAHQVSCMQLY